MVSSTSTVQASPERHPEVFYRQTIFRIARNWARVSNAPWAKVKDPLFTQCPRSGDYQNWTKDDSVTLDSNNRSSIIGLGVYFLASKCCHGGHIVPYLLWIENHLLDVSYIERKSGQYGKCLPTLKCNQFDRKK